MAPKRAHDDIALRHSGMVEVLTREGTITHMGGGKWVRVVAELENLTLRLDSSKLGNASKEYCKEMTITAGTTVQRAPQQGRPYTMAVADFNAATGKKRLLDCMTSDGLETWLDLLRRVATTDLDTLLEPLREAREKERDASELEAALAARPARVDAALLALRRGRLDVDYVGRDASERGVTALLASARAARADAVSALLILKALPDGPHHRSSLAPVRPRSKRTASSAEPRVEETPLLGAVRCDALKACVALLDAGADPTLQDDSRETPLLAAARLGGAKSAAALLRCIAEAAAQADDAKRRSEFLAHPDDEFGIDPSTALVAAAAAGHNTVVAALAHGARAGSDPSVVCRASVERRDSEGKTAMHHAAIRGRASVVFPLADAGADVDARDSNGNAPLQLAIADGHVMTVAALLQRDAAAPLQRQRPATDAAATASELVVTTAELRHALGAAEFDAARAGELAINVRKVLREASLVVTPLDDEARGESGDLFARPSLANDFDGSGRDRFHHHHGHQAGHNSPLSNFPADVCALPPARQHSALLRCCMNGDGVGVELWLKIGADANHADHDPRERCTPLMACATRGDRHLAKMLLATGRCEVDARDANGVTALGRAALAAARSRTVPVNAASARDVADLLLQHGADPLKRDHRDRSPLTIAAAEARDVQLVDRMMTIGLDAATAKRLGDHRRKRSLGGPLAEDDESPGDAHGGLAPTPAAGPPGIDVDAAHGPYGATALMLAAAMPEASAVLRTLLGAHDLAADAGLKQRRPAPKRNVKTADLRRSDKRGRTALFYAAEADRAENVELLLNFGRRASHDSADLAGMLDVDARDSQEQTALQVATAAHAKGAVGALLRFGASASSSHASALLVREAAASGRPHLSPISEGGRRVQVDFDSSDMESPLNDEAASCAGLAEYDAEIETGSNDARQRPLSIALDNGDAQIAGTLGRFRAAIVAGDDAATLRYVERGNYEVDEPAGLDRGACTALLVACRLGHAPAAARLLKAGADANKADARGETPLLAAARSGAILDATAARPATSRVDDDSKIVPLGELLLDAGANVNAVDDVRREAPLHVVAGGSERGAPRFVGGARKRGHAASLLLARGADPLKHDAAGRTPLLLCCGAWPPRDLDDDDHQSLGGAFFNNGPIRGDPPDAQAVLEALLEHHANHTFDLDHRHGHLRRSPADRGVLTALGAAALAGRLLAVRALLKAGAQPEAEADLKGRAALALAAEAGHAAIVQDLSTVSSLSHAPSGANQSRAALHAAAGAAQTATVAALLRAGATAEQTDAATSTPLDLADAIDGIDTCESAPPSLFDGDERSLRDRAAAVVMRLSVMRQAVEARCYARCAEYVVASNFSLVHGNGSVALVAAAREGDADGLAALLDAGGPELARALGPDALDAAARHRRVVAANVLLARCLSVGAAPRPAGAAALLALAVDVRDATLLDLALKAGADPATPSAAGADARHTESYDARDATYLADADAASRAIMRDLYARGHPTPALNDDDEASVAPLTALARAAAAPSPRGVEMLGKLCAADDAHGLVARALAASKSGPTVSPVHAAAAADRRESLGLLLSVMCRGSSSSGASDDVIQKVAAAAALSRDGCDRTPLHVAARNRSFDAAAVLIKRLGGADGLASRLLDAVDAIGAAPLARAAHVDDGAIVSLMLGAGANSEVTDSKGATALVRAGPPAMSHARRRLEAMRTAVEDGDFDKALRLIERGCFAVSATTLDGTTVLTRASACGREDVVETTLDLGSRAGPAVIISGSGNNGTTQLPGKSAKTAAKEMEAALTAASRCRQPTTAEALLKARCDVSVADEDAAPLLRLAVCRRRHGLIKLLLTRGAEPLAPCVAIVDQATRPPPTDDDDDRHNMSVLPVGDTADAFNRSTLTSVLDTTSFMISVATGDLEAVRIFLDQRYAVFDVDGCDDEGVTPLMEALRRGHVDVAHALLANGADAEARDKNGRSALERACFDEPDDKAWLRAVQVTLDECKKIAEIDAENRAVEEAQLAAQREREAAAAAAATEQGGSDYDDESDSDVVVQQPSRMQDLLRSSAIAAERKVLKRQLSPSKMAADSKTAIEARLDNALALAVAQRDVNAVHKLLEAGANARALCTDPKRRSDAETPLLRACRQPDLATLEAMLAHTKPAGRAIGFDVDAPHGQVCAAPLAVCAASGDADACRLLLDKGADVARLDANGRGPLWHAASRGHANVVQLLATHLKRINDGDGATAVSKALDAVDVNGATPLHAAACVGARPAIAALLSAGADATVRDESGRTPRRVAKDRGWDEAAAQLDAMSAAIEDGKLDTSRLPNQRLVTQVIMLSVSASPRMATGASLRLDVLTSLAGHSTGRSATTTPARMCPPTHSSSQPPPRALSSLARVVSSTIDRELCVSCRSTCAPGRHRLVRKGHPISMSAGSCRLSRFLRCRPNLLPRAETTTAVSVCSLSAKKKAPVPPPSTSRWDSISSPLFFFVAVPHPNFLSPSLRACVPAPHPLQSNPSEDYNEQLHILQRRSGRLEYGRDEEIELVADRVARVCSEELGNARVALVGAAVPGVTGGSPSTPRQNRWIGE